MIFNNNSSKMGIVSPMSSLRIETKPEVFLWSGKQNVPKSKP